MNRKFVIIGSLLTYLLVTAFSCENCRTGYLSVHERRSWLPLKGKTALTFRDNAGNLTSFPLQVVDTVETAINDCGDPYRYEYIEATLYLNTPATDSIQLLLDPYQRLSVYGESGGERQIGVFSIFSRPNEPQVSKAYSFYRAGTRLYREAVVLFSRPGTTGGIDSVVVANHAGIAGFRYAHKTYSLP